MTSLRHAGTYGLGSLSRTDRAPRKQGKGRMTREQRAERKETVSRRIYEKILVRPLCVPDLLKLDLGAYETELREAVAHLVASNLAERVPHPRSSKAFYKGIPQ